MAAVPASAFSGSDTAVWEHWNSRNACSSP